MRRVVGPVVALCLILAGCGDHHATTTTAHRAGPSTQCLGYQTQYGCQAHSPTFGIPPKGFPRAAAPSGTPTVAMYDAVTLSAIPARPPAVAGYLSGNWPTYLNLRAAFPAAIRIPVAIRSLPVYPSLVGRMACLDIEPGDAVPSSGGFWAKGEVRLGVIPCEYANLSTMPQVKASILAAGMRVSQVFLWVADWTFTPHLDAGYQATQWTDHYANRNLDASTATRAFLGIKPPAPPLPVCFHKHETRAACNTAKTQIAKDQHASASSQRAYDARGCPVLAQRVSWFTQRLKQNPNTKTQSRRSALAASRRVYARRSCGVYRQRASYFNAAAGKTQAAN